MLQKLITPIVLSLIVSSCSGTKQIVTTYPHPPAVLMSQPILLQSLSLKPAPPATIVTLRDIAAQHIEETIACKNTETQLLSLQQWLNEQLKLINKE